MFKRKVLLPAGEAAAFACSFSFCITAAVAQPQTAVGPQTSSAQQIPWTPPRPDGPAGAQASGARLPLDSYSALNAARSGGGAVPLTIEHLIATVLQFNPDLLSAQRARDTAVASVTTASALPNPSIEYTGGRQRPRVSDAASGALHGWGVSQLIENPSLRRARVDAARSGARGSAEQVAVQRNILVAEVRLRAYEHLLRQAEAEAAADALALLEQVQARVRARVSSGEAPRYELIKAESEIINAQQLRDSAMLRVDQTALALNRLAAGRLPPSWALRLSLIEDMPRPDMAALNDIRSPDHEERMWMTKKNQLAVCAMLALATQKESRRLALPLLAQRHGVSLTHFEDIFSRLRQFGLVSGLRGRNGGYVLARDPGSITIAEIVLAMDASPRWARCEKVAIEFPFVDEQAELWNALGEHALAFLGGITLWALAEKCDAQQGNSRRAGRISPLRCRAKSPMPRAPNSVFELANYSRVATS